MKYFCLALWMDILLTFPILLTIYILSFGSVRLFDYLIIIVANYAIGILARSIFKKRKRILPIIIVSVFSFIFSCLFLSKTFNTNLLKSFFYGIIILISGLRGINIAENKNTAATFPYFYYLTSIFIYFIAYFFYGKVIAFKDYQSYILISGLITIISSLFMINSQVIKNASGAELKHSTNIPTVKRNNRILITITIIVIMFISSYNVLKEYFLNGIKAVALFIWEVIDRIMNLFNSPIEEGPMGPANPTQEFLPIEETEPALWAEILENFFYIIAIAILVIAVFFILRYAIKAIMKLYRKLSDFLKRYFEGSYVDDDYFVVDEKESLINFKSLGKDYVDNFRKWWENILKKEPKWHDLTDNKQRIRYLYRQTALSYISEGYPFKIFKTSDETINDLAKDGKMDENLAVSLKKLYKEARYGDLDIADIHDIDVKNLKEGLDSAKKQEK